MSQTNPNIYPYRIHLRIARNGGPNERVYTVMHCSIEAIYYSCILGEMYAKPMRNISINESHHNERDLYIYIQRYARATQSAHDTMQHYSTL